MRLFPLLAAALLPLPALADTANDTGAGFWSYPGTPDLSPEDLGALCETGFSLVYADGHRQSFLLIDTDAGPTLLMDSEVECRSAGDQTACAGWVSDGTTRSDSTTVTRYDTATGALRAVTDVMDGSAPVTSYPQACPDSAVRAALALGATPAP